MSESGSPFDHGRFLAVCEAVFGIVHRTFGSEEGMDGRHGAAFAICDAYGIPLMMVVLGHTSIEKRAKYCRLVLEKASRLALMNKNSGHRTSRQSADPMLERYPGAVRGMDFICSISGFPADVDEIVAFCLTILINDIDRDEAIRLAVHNNHRPRLRAMLKNLAGA